MVKKDSYGLVLAGGGGKGAYEIGAWKALREFKDISIGAVSGTSVGALNAALFACQEYELAEKIWMNISQDKILPLRAWSLEDCLEILTILQPGLMGMKLSYANSLRIYFKSQRGMFSREGLKEIIRQSDVMQNIRNGKMPCYATCYNLKEFRTQYFLLNQMMPDQIQKVLLASSALPIIYPMEELDGVKYWDGGLPVIGDNVPVKPLHDAGWRKFIVVHLSRETEEDSKRYGDSVYVDVFPSIHQGDLFSGTLDFSRESSQRRIRQGYDDMIRQFKIVDKLNGKFDGMENLAGGMKSSARELFKNMKEQFPSMEEESQDGGQLLKMETAAENIQKNVRNMKDSMNKGVIEITADLSASRAFADELENGNLLQRLLNIVTWNKKGLEIDKRQNHSIELLTKKLNVLVNNDKLSMELTEAVWNELRVYIYQLGKGMNRQGRQMDELKVLIDRHENRFSDLKKQYAELGNQIEKFSHTLESHIADDAKAMRRLEERIDGLESRMAVCQWAETVRYREFYGYEYRKLNICQKIVCVVSDFFKVTKGKWDDLSLLFLKAVLEKLEMDPEELIAVGGVISLLACSREYREYLFERNGLYCNIFCKNQKQMSLCEILLEGIYIGSRMEEDGLETENGSEAYLQLRGLDGAFRLTAFQMICELLVGMLQLKSALQPDAF